MFCETIQAIDRIEYTQQIDRFLRNAFEIGLFISAKK